MCCQSEGDLQSWKNAIVAARWVLPPGTGLQAARRGGPDSQGYKEATAGADGSDRPVTRHAAIRAA